MSLDQLLRYVSQETGLPDLSLNSHGVCQFTVDDSIVITVEDAPLQSSAHFYSTIAHAPDSQRETLFATLLEAQLFGREIGEGSAFGFERSTGEILLCRTLRIDGVDNDGFAEALSEFIAWAEHWHSKLKGFSETSTTTVSEVPTFFIRA